VKARGLTIGIVIVLLYYLAQLCGSALTETGKVSPWIGMWFPTAIFTIAGICLFARAAKEDKTGMGSVMPYLMSFVKRKQRQ